MQNVIIEEPYQFVPPKHGTFWPRAMRFFIRRHIEKAYGVTDIRFRDLEKLSASMRSGNGVLLTPNHCYPADPFVLGLIERELGVPPYIMASWHLFRQNKLQTWLLPRLRVFSVYREGLDSSSVREASRILSESNAPLIIFPEGLITRSNDCLAELLDGPAFIARAAAKEKAKANSSSGVVIHPVALRYRYQGDVNAAVRPVLDEIESRLSWRPRKDETVQSRIVRIGAALLGLKEIEYLGTVQTGTIAERLQRLTDAILSPLEEAWEIKRKPADVPGRVRAIRAAILPELVEKSIDEKERERRWQHLADLYLAQQLSLYPADYVGAGSSPDRIRETVERFEEDLTDTSRVYRPLSVEVSIGDAIPVGADKETKTSELTERVKSALSTMLGLTGGARSV